MANISSLSQRLIAAGVTADQLTAQGRRFWGDDTAWSALAPALDGAA